jgi:ribose/xylose/arabinose/galactoside ABC-type transport system permease subunit
MLQTLRFVSLVCAALVAGLTVTHVLEIPGKRALSGAEWLAVQHTFYGGFAVVGGIGEVVGLLATCGLLVLLRHRRTAFVLTLVAALSFLGMLLSYFLGNRPINDLVAVWTPATLPPDWPSYRDAWDTAHAISAGFALLALVVLLIATLRDTTPTATGRADSLSAAA